MVSEIVYDTVVGAWIGNVVVEEFEINFTLFGDKIKIVTFRNDGSFLLSDYEKLQQEIDNISQELYKIKESEK